VCTDEAFEDTLVSVLENRPSGCEVLVVHRQQYQDPYDLSDEVRFIEVESEDCEVETVNAGMLAAKGDILHILQPGVLASEGWTKPAVEWFDDPDIGAVAPLVLSNADSNSLVSAGLRVTSAGRRLLNGQGARLDRCKRVFRRRIDGPTIAAAFYRNAALKALGGLCSDVGCSLADADIAMSLRELDLRCVIEPDSRLLGGVDLTVAGPSLDAGRCAERLFWRHAARHGWIKSLFCHSAYLTAGAMRGWNSGASYADLFGRFLASLERRGYRMHREQIHAATALKQRGWREDCLTGEGSGLRASNTRRAA
jgi:hypothetical protein